MDVVEIPSLVKETELPKIEKIEKIERPEQHQIDLINIIFDIFTHNPKKAFTRKAIINKLYREKSIEIKTPIISPILDRLLDSGLIKQELYEEECYYSFKTSVQTDIQLKLKLAIFNILKSNYMRKLTPKEILKYLNREKHTIIYSQNIEITGYHLQDMYRRGIINRQLFNNKVYFQFIKDPNNEFVMREGLEEIVNLISKTLVSKTQDTNNQDINIQDINIQDTVMQPECQSTSQLNEIPSLVEGIKFHKLSQVEEIDRNEILETYNTGTVCGIIFCFLIPFAGSFLAFLYTLWMIKMYPKVGKYTCVLVISIILMITNFFRLYMFFRSN